MCHALMGSLKIACQEISFPEELRMLHACTRRMAQYELMPLERLYANDPDIADDVRAALQAKAKELGFRNHPWIPPPGNSPWFR